MFAPLAVETEAAGADYMSVVTPPDGGDGLPATLVAAGRQHPVNLVDDDHVVGGE